MHKYKPLTLTQEAIDEIRAKTDKIINVETAYKWAGRAVASYLEFNRTEGVEWLFRAEDYRHEAIEHAALVGDGGELLKMLEEQIEPYRPDYCKNL
jgi:hypothetical protein